MPVNEWVHLAQQEIWRGRRKGGGGRISIAFLWRLLSLPGLLWWCALNTVAGHLSDTDPKVDKEEEPARKKEMRADWKQNSCRDRCYILEQRSGDILKTESPRRCREAWGARSAWGTFWERRGVITVEQEAISASTPVCFCLFCLTALLHSVPL